MKDDDPFPEDERRHIYMSIYINQSSSSTHHQALIINHPQVNLL